MRIPSCTPVACIRSSSLQACSCRPTTFRYISNPFLASAVHSGVYTLASILPQMLFATVSDYLGMFTTILQSTSAYTTSWPAWMLLTMDYRLHCPYLILVWNAQYSYSSHGHRKLGRIPSHRWSGSSLRYGSGMHKIPCFYSSSVLTLASVHGCHPKRAYTSLNEFQSGCRLSHSPRTSGAFYSSPSQRQPSARNSSALCQARPLPRSEDCHDRGIQRRRFGPRDWFDVAYS